MDTITHVTPNTINGVESLEKNKLEKTIYTILLTELGQ
jgi:hypothetical protein